MYLNSLCLRFILLFGLLILMTSGVLRGQEERSLETNATCPVDPGEPIDPSISVQHDGRTVYLCCKRCLREFTKNPEQYVTALPQFSATREEGHDSKVHDHSTDHGRTATEKIGPISFLGRFHPLIVHFPIALILMAGVLELFGVMKRNPVWKNVARINLFFGASSAIVAALLGWAAATDSNYPSLTETLFWHRWLGTSLAVLAILVYVVGWVAKRKASTQLERGYQTLLLLLCLLVIFTGHLGGVLVFGPDQFN